jgi:RHS repeat-associated protein
MTTCEIMASCLKTMVGNRQPYNVVITNSGHTAKKGHLTNNVLALTDTANSMLVALYTVDPSQVLVRTTANAGNYAAGQLRVTVSKDENWKSGRGGTTEEYKDKLGHVVLKRTFNYVAGPPAVLQILSTYYVYDDYGNLAFVLPPISNADNVQPAQTVLDNLCYQYRYDERNRLIQKKMPGKGWEYMVYNKLDQLVLSQDANQRLTNQWSVTKYDAIGRVIMGGVWNAGAVIAQATLQSNIYGAAQWDSGDKTNNTTTYPSGYVLSSYPKPSTILKVNYYDTYTNIPGIPAAFVVTGNSSMTKGLLTATKTTVLNTITNTTPDTLWAAHYYDDLGRNTKTFQQHYLGGVLNANNYDVVNSTYNFNSQVTTTTRQHFTSASTTVAKVTVINRYIYDHMGRKLKTWEQIQNGALAADTRTLVSQTDYNEIGQLWKKHLHSTDSATFKQDIAYAYNERGWLRTSSAQLFEEQLQYNTTVAQNGLTPVAQYNGNIASQSWGTLAAPDTKTYIYKYDQLNRLTEGTASNLYSEQGITYDKMGNITALKRYTGSATATDDLTYNYLSGSNVTNQLQSITDGTASDVGQKHGTFTYAYDANGNMVTDNSKGITGTTGITYNLLNLPQSIASQSITYTYDAAGQKLRRVVGTAGTDYISGIQYDASTSVISFIQTEEGRALPNSITAYNYEYSLTDHLGNSRMNFDTGTGAVRQVQTDDYYPFGMDIASGSRLSPPNYYLYNRKELQIGLGLYDYGARFYDPMVGRWTSVDPLAEKSRRFSPYTYVDNNPIRLIDPDGMRRLYFTEISNGDNGNGGETESNPQKNGTITYIDNKGKIVLVDKNYSEIEGDRYIVVSSVKNNPNARPTFGSFTEVSPEAALKMIMAWSYNALNAISSATTIKAGLKGAHFMDGFYRNSKGVFSDVSLLAKFKPAISLGEQGNISRAFTEYRSSTATWTNASRVLGVAVTLWDASKWLQGDENARGATMSDLTILGFGEIPFIGPPTAGFLWLNSFIPESPSSNFANPGRTPGHYAEWLR